MVTAVKKISQVATHMGIAFIIGYWMTGSMMFGGAAALLEPVINVLLLPFHEKAWRAIRRADAARKAPGIVLAAQKLSQTALHMIVAFAVIYWASGSMAFGGVAAVLEPVCNVILLPFHDRAWEHVRTKLDGRRKYADMAFA